MTCYRSDQETRSFKCRGRTKACLAFLDRADVVAVLEMTWTKASSDFIRDSFGIEAIQPGGRGGCTGSYKLKQSARRKKELGRELQALKFAKFGFNGSPPLPATGTYHYASICSYT